MEECIRVEHISKTLGDFKLEDINFSIRSGYVLGLIGRNGAGKTTLLNTILGLWAPEEGSIYIAGYDRVHDDVKAKNEIAFVTDECIFPMEMTAASIGKLYGGVYDKFDYKQYENLCKRFRIPRHKALKKMSKGSKMKLQLAFAFSRDAKLYVFDEPSSGLDPVFRKELIDIIYELIEDGNRSVIFSTHLTDELDRIADYILFIEDGKQILFEQKEELVSRYKLLRGTVEQIEQYKDKIIGKRITPNSSEALVRIGVVEDNDMIQDHIVLTIPTIEDIMYYFIKGSVRESC